MIIPPNLQQRRWILAALMMTITLAAMDTTVVSTAIPQIVGSLGGFAIFSWVFSIYLLAQTVTIPVYGKLADSLGRKPVLMVGTTIFLGGSLLSALAWNMTTLILFRGIQGLGAGAIMATVYTLVGDLYSARERAVVEGWLSSVWGVTAIVGPTLGGALSEYASWRWIFLINLPVGAGALFLLGKFLREQPEHRSHRVDYAGAVLLLLAGSAVIFWLLQGGEAWPWWSTESIAIFFAAIVLISITVLVETRAAEPIMPGWLWRRRVLAGANVATIGMGIIMMGPNTYLPTFGQAVFGLGPIGAGLMLASMSIGWPLASSWSGRLYLRIGFRDTALCGAVLIVLAVAGFLLLPFPGSVALLVADQVLLGAGFGLLSTPLLVGVQGTVTWHERGVVTGANVFSRNLGQSLGAAICGAIFNAASSHELTVVHTPLRESIPHGIDAVLGALEHHTVTGDAREFLRHVVYIATHRVYAGLAVLAILTLTVVLLTPHQFPIVSDSGHSEQ